MAKNEQALAAKIVAAAQLANVKVGTHVEVIAARKAEVVLAQKTYDRASPGFLIHARPLGQGGSLRTIQSRTWLLRAFIAQVLGQR